MSFINLEEAGIKYANSPAVDPFARLRVSQVDNLFDYQSQYSIGPRDWETQVVGTGAVTHVPLEGATQLATGGTANGASAIRATRLCWRNQMGKGQQVFFSFVFGSIVANVVRRIGYFDANNGIFLQQGSDVRFVVRSGTSGVPSDALFAAQADWNQDKLDGSGPSGITLDLTKIQNMFIDFSGTGGGRARCGFFFAGVAVVAHEFIAGNSVAVPAIASSNLPIRQEIFNNGIAGSSATLKAHGVSVMSEGGSEFLQRGNLNSASNGITSISVTTRRPVLSVRPAATFGGLTNRAWYLLIEALFKVKTNDIYWEIVFGGTLSGGGGPVWNAAFADSCVEYDVTANSISGGVSVLKGFAVAGQGSQSGSAVAEVAGRFPNSVTSLNNVQGAHTIVATSFTGTAEVSSAFNWREIY